MSERLKQLIAERKQYVEHTEVIKQIPVLWANLRFQISKDCSESEGFFRLTPKNPEQGIYDLNEIKVSCPSENRRLAVSIYSERRLVIASCTASDGVDHDRLLWRKTYLLVSMEDGDYFALCTNGVVQNPRILLSRTNLSEELLVSTLSLR